MKSKTQRIQEGQIRAELRANRSPREQLARLDQKLGVGVGAARERMKLREELDAEVSKRIR